MSCLRIGGSQFKSDRKRVDKAMQTLLIDIGNSRIKWGLLENDMIKSEAPFSYKNSAICDVFDRAWGGLPRPDQVVVSNVAGQKMAYEIAGWSQKKWGLDSQLIYPEAQAFGVVNGYRNVSQIGVDRWVCLVAAHRIYHRPVCVVDCGTALTIDVLDDKGNHLGGMIAPGIKLMKCSLLENTSDIDEASESQGGFLGRSTGGSVQSGVIQATTGMIEYTLLKLEKEFGRLFFPVLTGGDAELIGKRLGCEVKFDPDLLLRGLAIMAKEVNR